MATGGGMMPPGQPEQAPQQWRPGQGGPPPNQAGGDSEGESGDEGAGAAKMKMKLDGFNVPGYDNMRESGVAAQCQPPPFQPPTGQPPDMKFNEISVLTEQDCRDAIVNLAAENCCYGSKPAKQMTFSKVTPATALHYTLETYGESRSTKYKHTPFRGGFVDGPENGMPPPPWAIPCQPDQLFVNQVKKIEVPHTSVIKTCTRCGGCGWNQCSRCHGRGRVRCNMCHGSGRRMHREPDGRCWEGPCHYCHGDGRRSCHRCGGDGRVTCSTCAGFGKLRFYVELKVSYINHLDDYILEETDMPDELVRQVGGKPVFEQTLPLVWPIVAYPIAVINQNSQNLVNAHRTRYTSERIHMQRQVLRAVPVTEVEWTWEDYRNKRFWAYGNEHRVYCPDYPHQCCWGCEIL